MASHYFVRRVYSPRFCLVTTKIWSDGHQSPRRITALGSWTDCVIALRQISVTVLFYLENSRTIHPPGVRACRPKDANQHVGERERALCLLPAQPPGLPYVTWASQECCLFCLKPSLRSSGLSLTILCSIFMGFSLPCLLAAAILDSCFLF